MQIMLLVIGNYSVWQWLFVLAVLTFESVSDIRSQHIYTKPLIGATLAALLLRALLVDSGIREFICNLVPGVIWMLVSIPLKKYIGAGDGLTCLFLGSLLGYRMMLSGLYPAFILAAAVSIFLLATGLGKRDTKLPFVPFLELGAVAAGFLA